jgi:hypothetical protein
MLFFTQKMGISRRNTCVKFVNQLGCLQPDNIIFDSKLHQINGGFQVNLFHHITFVGFYRTDAD